MNLNDEFEGALVAQIPAIIKARPLQNDGRRIVDVECSNETVDYDGDVILQKALLDSAASFIATGHLDIDHLSEFGARLGIPNPTSYIVGRPLEVRGEAGNRTFMEGEISRSFDRTDDPTKNKYDEFWASLRRDPPVIWFASIYGWPTDLEDCTKGICSRPEATRFVIKAMDWRSLAFTMAPKNFSLKSACRIVTAKSYIEELSKKFPPTRKLPDRISDAAEPCPNCEVEKTPSLVGYRKHFKKCRGCSEEHSDLLAHAVMYRTVLQRAVAKL